MQVRSGIVVDDQAFEAVCSRYNIRELALFGSSARGDFRPDSDVDVLVELAANARVSLFDLADLQAELTDLVGVRVDLVTKGGLKPLIRDRVLREARRLYAA